MTVLDEFILQYSINVKNAQALDQLQAKQKLFGDGAKQFVGDVGHSVSSVLDQLSKISPEANKVLGFLSQVTQRLSTLPKGQTFSLVTSLKQGSSAPAVSGNSTLTLTGPVVIHAPNAVVNAKERSSSLLKEGTVSSVEPKTTVGNDAKDGEISSAKEEDMPSVAQGTTMTNVAEKTVLPEVGEAVAVAEGGEVAAGGGAVAGALALALNPVTLAAATLAGTFCVLSKMVSDFEHTWEQQFSLGNKLGLSTQQVESNQRSLVVASGGFLDNQGASTLMNKIGTMGKNAASTFNVTSRENLLFNQAGVKARDNKGQYIGTQKLLENLADSFAKMTEERAQAIGQNMGLEYQEIEALRKNTEAMRSQHQLTDQEIILRQRAKESIAALKQAQTEMAQEWHRLGQLLSTYFTPIVDSLYMAFDKIVTMVLKTANWLLTPAQTNPDQRSKSDKAALERAHREEEQTRRNTQEAVKTNQQLSLLTDALTTLNTTLNSSNDYYAAWAGEFNQRLNDSRSVSSSPAQTTQESKAVTNTSYDGLIQGAAQRYHVDASIVKALLYQESGLNPLAISKAGAIGLGQIMPDTARGYGVDPHTLINPAVNIDLSVRHLRELLRHYHNDLRLALMANNAGQGNIDHWLKTGKFLNGKAMPKETQTYADDVLRHRTPLRAPQPIPAAFTPTNPYPYARRKTGRDGYMEGNTTSELSEMAGIPIPQMNTGHDSIYDLKQAENKMRYFVKQKVAILKQRQDALKSAPPTLGTLNLLKQTTLEAQKMTAMGSALDSVTDDFNHRAQQTGPQRTIGLPDNKEFFPSSPTPSPGTSPVIVQHNTYTIHGAHDDHKIVEKIKEYHKDSNQKLAAYFGSGNIA
ncbi:Membrane-bound lytic murein transglycosylase C [Commensalibacter sp. Nvir]|uniref:transglycosylase SLT domain-containing protein n=1 Tax=Commensalibacter sp. Nvir TaxID=3069817 RepID=UPI002D4F946A|nr:Membrane-bound lytic murein transglycosylase C [Commensalibacter sp. Nvir]